MPRAWPEARWKQAEAATREADKKSLANMRIAGIDPIATMVSGGRISDHDPRVARRSGPSRRGWGWNEDERFEYSRIMSCPECKCAGVPPVQVG
jgi:hypothetical protein